MNLPPWMRAIQQTAAFHVVVAALILFFITLYKCAGDNFTQFGWDCISQSLHAAGGVIIAYLAGAFQHSPNSATFLPSGVEDPQVKILKAREGN